MSIEGRSESLGSVTSWVREHPGLLASALIFVWVVFRVIRATKGDITSALAVMQASGTVNVGLGVLTDSFGTVVLVIFFLVEILRTKSGASETSLPAKTINWLLLVNLGVIVIASVSLALVLLYAVIYLLSMWSRTKKITPYSSREEIAVAGLIALVPVLLFYPGSSMWLPPETVTIQGPQTPTVSYVLNDNGNWLTYLDDESRTVHRVRSDLVIDRSLCSLASDSWLWIPVTRLGDASELPDCP